ncbi:MAG: helix-turn-helix domain-containing protein, partial [Prevotella sp.]|nr:helix-turn-helix domain-containing protein [Prevotella sp.]
RSIAQLPLLKEEYHRQLLLELFDFREMLYSEEHLLRLMSEFFYHSHTDLTERHKRVLADFSARVITVSNKWEQQLRQMPLPQLRDETFLERVRRSASYFEETIDNVFGNVLTLTTEVKSNNKQAMSRFTEALAAVRQAVLSRRCLLERISALGFEPSTYLREKQHALLDALDEDLLKKRKTKAPKAPKAPKPKKEPKEKTWNITRQLYDQGLTPDAIAKERGLTLGTIMGHLSRFVATGEISLSDILSKEHHEAILKAVRLIGPDDGRTAIKNLCPPEVTYAEIELVLSTME